MAFASDVLNSPEVGQGIDALRNFNHLHRKELKQSISQAVVNGLVPFAYARMANAGRRLADKVGLTKFAQRYGVDIEDPNAVGKLRDYVVNATHPEHGLERLKQTVEKMNDTQQRLQETQDAAPGTPQAGALPSLRERYNALADRVEAMKSQYPDGVFGRGVPDLNNITERAARLSRHLSTAGATPSQMANALEERQQAVVRGLTPSAKRSMADRPAESGVDDDRQAAQRMALSARGGRAETGGTFDPDQGPVPFDLGSVRPTPRGGNVFPFRSGAGIGNMGRSTSTLSESAHMGTGLSVSGHALQPDRPSLLYFCNEFFRRRGLACASPAGEHIRARRSILGATSLETGAECGRACY